MKKLFMYYKLFSITVTVLLFSCTQYEKESIVGKWQLMDIKAVCNSAYLQKNFGDYLLPDETPEITYVFFPDSSFKKTSERQKHTWSSSDNLEGLYNVAGDSIQLIVGSVPRETFYISEISDDKLILISKNILTSDRAPGEKCDMIHYFEK